MNYLELAHNIINSFTPEMLVNGDAKKILLCCLLGLAQAEAEDENVNLETILYIYKKELDQISREWIDKSLEQQ